MKILFANILLLFASIPVFAQNVDRTTVCGTDTINVSSPRPATYKAFDCVRASNLGLRIETGVSRFQYDARTAGYLGKVHGPLFGIALAYKNFNVSMRTHLSSVAPQKDLLVGEDTITAKGRINPTVLHYALAYSLNIKYNFAAEPFIGFSKSIFTARKHRDDRNETGTLRKTYGAIAGLTVNKYFKVHDLDFIALFASGAWSSANLGHMDDHFGKGYFEWSVGVAYKAFYYWHFDKRIPGTYHELL